MKVYIDFESRSQSIIWDTGAYRYAEDPSTEVLCLAWAVDDKPVDGVLYHRLKYIVGGMVFSIFPSPSGETQRPKYLLMHYHDNWRRPPSHSVADPRKIWTATSSCGLFAPLPE